jgi:molecular chaperone GrpE
MRVESTEFNTGFPNNSKGLNSLQEEGSDLKTQDQHDAEPSIDGELDKASASENPLQKKVAELEAELKEKEARYVYLYAEFENFKKRAQKERGDLLKFGWENVARDLLQVVDNLERAVEHAPASTDRSLTDGLLMIISQFKNTMQKQGVETIESLDKPFDPNFHEAVSQEASDKPEGVIVKEHGKGYSLHGRLLRPARVVVSSGS